VVRAKERFLEFFTAQIRNKNTREAYFRAVSRFFGWCQKRGLALDDIRPVHVATYIESFTIGLADPSVKQHLAAIRMLFDWLVTGQIVDFNPASAMRGPRHVVKKGKTPALTAEEARQLLESIPTGGFKLQVQGGLTAYGGEQNQRERDDKTLHGSHSTLSGGSKEAAFQADWVSMRPESKSKWASS
jgi:integrase